MGWDERVSPDRDTEVSYRQFEDRVGIGVLRTVLGVLTWPLVMPMALLSRISDFFFRSCSELLALIPYAIGVVVRGEFCRWTLPACGRNVTIGFGTVLFYRDISIGDNVAIGNFNVLQHCDIGSYVLIADGCQFLSGRHYHNFERVDIPIAKQGGKLRRIQVGDDCWIGASTVVMANVGKGCVVGAGAVVNRGLEPYSVAAGNPVRVLKMRG